MDLEFYKKAFKVAIEQLEAVIAKTKELEERISQLEEDSKK